MIGYHPVNRLQVDAILTVSYLAQPPTKVGILLSVCLCLSLRLGPEGQPPEAAAAMTLKFDEYYTYACKPTPSPRKPQPSASTSSFIPGCGNVLDRAVMLFTYMSRRQNPQASEWTLWTLRDPEMKWLCAGTDKIRVRQTKAEFLEAVYRSAYHLCYEFGQILPNAIVVSHF